MIDKLDLRLPAGARLSSEVRAFVYEGEFLPFSCRSHRSQHYQSVTDLRPIGIDAILHKGLRRHGTAYTGTHKLEILDAGWKGHSDWLGVIEHVTDASPDDLRIMRLDTCADLFGVPVAWFLDKTRVRFKRAGRNIGDSKWSAISNRSVETLTAGKKPNHIRIYDKVEERLQDYRKFLRRAQGTIAGKSFEELNGFPESATVTRVERQHSSRGVPSSLTVFGDLPGAADYNPFDCLEITDAAAPDDFLTRDDLSVSEILEGVGALCLREKWGMQSFARWFNTHSKGNWSRFKGQRPYLFEAVKGTAMKQRISEEWRKSTMQQLTA